MISGQRQRDGDLAVVLLADLTAVLARHTDRVAAFLGHSGVIDDPEPERATLQQGRQHQILDRVQNGTIIPGGLGDEMMQGLVGGADPAGFDTRGHRLDALALPR